MADNDLWLFLAVPWVGLQCVIVIFPDHTHLLFKSLFAPEICLMSHEVRHNAKKYNIFRSFFYFYVIVDISVSLVSFFQ